MATIEENRSTWNGSYHWRDSGEEWSTAWGTPYMQWYGTLLPRIHSFLPAPTVLEIAPGFGRWTEFLKDFCTNLMLIDLSEKCIKACQERFSSCSHITYFVNDGMSLEMVPDNTIDFIFSFDSLVHAEDTTILAYISQLSRKLKPNGVAFIHHSNLGEYLNSLNVQRKIRKISKSDKLRDTLVRFGVLDNLECQWRAPSMTARKMRSYAKESGLQCISQELITWETRSDLVDCISTITKKNSIWSRDNRVLKNMFFVKEAENLSKLSHLYDMRSRR